MSDRRKFLASMGKLGALVSAGLAMPTRLYADERAPGVERTDGPPFEFPPGSEDEDLMRITTVVDFSQRGDGYRIGPIDLNADAIRKIGEEEETLPVVMEQSGRMLAEQMKKDGMVR